MNKTNLLRGWTSLTCAGALLLALVGCVGVVGPGYVEPGYIDVYGPGPVVFGGWGRGHFDHDAGRRGAVSRGHR